MIGSDTDDLPVGVFLQPVLDNARGSGENKMADGASEHAHLVNGLRPNVRRTVNEDRPGLTGAAQVNDVAILLMSTLD
jgi:hypothetical protein